jgi:hypothetical protein
MLKKVIWRISLGRQLMTPLFIIATNTGIDPCTGCRVTPAPDAIRGPAWRQWAIELPGRH